MFPSFPGRLGNSCWPADRESLTQGASGTPKCASQSGAGAQASPQGLDLEHVSKKGHPNKAGARTTAKSSSWQKPRLLQAPPRLVPVGLLMPGITEFYGDPH